MTHADVSVAGHFGEWLQGRLGPDGPVVLVTLPCPALTVRARAAGGARLEGGESGNVYAPERLRAFLARLGLPSDEFPEMALAMPPGAGAGASTAALVAVARWAGFDGRPEDLACACLATEGATDPLMWPEPDRLLWASREARVIRHLPAPPTCDILGGFWGPPTRTDPHDAEFGDATDLAQDWNRAVAHGDLVGVASVASRSSALCYDLRGPDDPMADLARDLGALGQVRAHTGSARGLIFAPDTVPPHGEHALRDAGLTGILTFRTGAA